MKDPLEDLRDNEKRSATLSNGEKLYLYEVGHLYLTVGKKPEEKQIAIVKFDTIGYLNKPYITYTDNKTLISEDIYIDEFKKENK